MYKLIVLDRDGVINKDSPAYIKSPEEWQAVVGSVEAIAKLNRCGYRVVVATNQSGIARGYLTLDTLDAIHKKMLSQIEEVGGRIEAIFTCPHGPEDSCECRKPRSGLLLQAAKQFNINPTEILVIGDSARDMLAAQNCGAAAIFIKTEGKPDDLAMAKKACISVYADLAAAVTAICNKI